MDQTVAEGSLVTIDGTFSDPGIYDTHTFLWQVAADNGEQVADGTGEDFSFTPSDDGVYTVTYTVADSEGGVGIDSMVVTVRNVAPAVAVPGPAVLVQRVYVTHLGGSICRCHHPIGL